MNAPLANPGQVLDFVRAVEALDDRALPADPAVAAEIARVWSRLRAIAVPTAGLPRSDHPIVGHLAAALAAAAGPAVEVTTALGAVAEHLPWRYGYPRRADAPDLGERIAFAEIIGPEAPFRSEVVCLGVTLIAPRTLYPDHHHPAIELYRVLTGSATWSAAGRSRRVPPGELVLHPSGVVHAMRTEDEPLLAVYTWSGDDVRTSSVYA